MICHGTTRFDIMWPRKNALKLEESLFSFLIPRATSCILEPIHTLTPNPHMGRRIWEGQSGQMRIFFGGRGSHAASPALAIDTVPYGRPTTSACQTSSYQPRHRNQIPLDPKVRIKSRHKIIDTGSHKACSLDHCCLWGTYDECREKNGIWGGIGRAFWGWRRLWVGPRSRGQSLWWRPWQGEAKTDPEVMRRFRNCVVVRLLVNFATFWKWCEGREVLIA